MRCKFAGPGALLRADGRLLDTGFRLDQNRYMLFLIAILILSLQLSWNFKKRSLFGG